MFAHVSLMLLKKEEETDKNCAEQEIKGSRTKRLHVLLCSRGDSWGQQNVPGFTLCNAKGVSISTSYR